MPCMYFNIPVSLRHKKIPMIAESFVIACAIKAFGTTFFVNSLIVLVQVRRRTKVYFGEGYNIASVLCQIRFIAT